ncbi:MAG: hypothetical protein O3A25_04455 [Acidobacteria bacterium]|nr:hypothetical protein [Acidobacteriota bacterium]
MMKPATVVVCLLAAAVTGMPLVSIEAGTAQPDPEVSRIIALAVERAEWGQTQDFGARFRRTMTQRSQRFDDQGETIDDEIRGYAIEPHRGVPYASLVTKDGEPIAGDDLAQEHKRWQAFLDELEEPPDPEDEDDEISVEFDEELLSRYAAELVGVRDLRGRPTYLLDFEPRPGKLPVRRRVDHALNHSRGQVWIDQKTYEIAQVNFELIERVRFWWGILGSVSEANGHYTRVPVADNTWLASEVDIYFHVRALFSTSRRREVTAWSEFEPIAD